MSDAKELEWKEWIKRNPELHKRQQEITAIKQKEYYEKNSEKGKEYRLIHKEELNKKAKEYRLTHKEEIIEKGKETMTCSCGSIITKKHILRHKLTKKHIQNSK